MNLVSMKFSAEELAEREKSYAEPCSPDGSRPEYPWGLCLDLNDDSLAKLGITDLPPVGTKLMVMAHVEVVSTGENKENGGDKEIRMSLQITEMALSAPVDADAATKLWPNP